MSLSTCSVEETVQVILLLKLPKQAICCWHESVTKESDA